MCYNQNMALKWYHVLPAFLIALFFAILINLIPKTFITINEESTSLPSLNLSLSDTTLSDIIADTKDTKFKGNSLTLTIDDESFDFTDVEIKSHGNSTRKWPKSPFQIKFSNKVDLLGMGKAKKWILLANFFDKSNLRTDIAFYLERMLNEEYALEGRFIELYIDNEYQGLYYLTEKVNISKNRINLKDELGIIVELDNLHIDEETCYYTKENHCLIIHDSVVPENEEEAIKEFVTDFNALEQAAKSGDYELIKQLIDTASFAKYFLLSEFTVNPDAYASSFFFYKDGSDDKIHAGPGWDFDFSLGNLAWVWSRTEDFYSPETTRVIEKHAFGGKVYDETAEEYITLEPDNTISKLTYYLYRIPEFKAEVAQIYRQQMMGKKDELICFIRSETNHIRSTAIRDKELWRESNSVLLEKLGLSPDDPNKDNIFHDKLPADEAFDLEVKSLIDWIDRRFDHFDYEYSGIKEYPVHLAYGY